MEEKRREQSEELEIDLGRVFRAIMDRAWLVILVTVLCAAIALGVTFHFIAPEYEASASFYVNNNSLSVGDASLSLSSGDISAAKDLVESYIVILDSWPTLDQIIEQANVDLLRNELAEMITAESVNDTEIFRVTITSNDPNEAEKIANAVAVVLPDRNGEIIEGTSARVVETALVPSSPSSPSYPKNTVIGFMLGFLLSVAVIALREIFDNTVRSEMDVEQACRYPILAAVPDMIMPSKGGYYYDRDEKGRQKKMKHTANAERPVIGGDISFAASEAYKLLRTMLEYSFADEKNCRVIGVTSAMTGEGKSLTAVNMALNLAQMRNKVLLIDCDMRCPSVAAKLGLGKTPGLSGFLSGQKDMNSLIRLCGIKGNEKAFHVITSGTNPPNPMELLGSVRMEKMLDVLREPYDYIILDLPPISEVSDALVVAKRTDGMLMVVRENYCSRSLLGEAVSKLEFVGARVLGVTYNCTDKESGRYGKAYYKRYYKRGYYGKNGSPYAQAEGMPMDIPHVEL